MISFWYIDPVWAAKQVNVHLDTTDFNEVKKYALIFSESMYFENNYVKFKRLNKIKGEKEKFSSAFTSSFNLIHSDGIQKVPNVSGGHLNWRQGGNFGIQIGPYTIVGGKIFSIKLGFQLHNPTITMPEEVIVEEELEYIDE